MCNTHWKQIPNGWVASQLSSEPPFPPFPSQAASVLGLKAQPLQRRGSHTDFPNWARHPEEVKNMNIHDTFIPYIKPRLFSRPVGLSSQNRSWLLNPYPPPRTLARKSRFYTLADHPRTVEPKTLILSYFLMLYPL